MSMQAVIPRDAEYALATDLIEFWGHDAYPTPLPDGYASALPCALVTSVGGSHPNMVVYEHALSVDVYGATWADADEQSRTVAAIVAALPTVSPTSGNQWHVATINAMPYPNPDPNNRNTPRCSMTVLVTLRGSVTTIEPIVPDEDEPVPES